jgi:hypothetical protein
MRLTGRDFICADAAEPTPGQELSHRGKTPGDPNPGNDAGLRTPDGPVRLHLYRRSQDRSRHDKAGTDHPPRPARPNVLPRQARDTTNWRVHRWSSPVLDGISMAAVCLSVAALIAQMIPDAVHTPTLARTDDPMRAKASELSTLTSVPKISVDAHGALHRTTQGACPVKGIAWPNGRRFYLSQADYEYHEHTLDRGRGDQCFQSELDAQRAGWRRADIARIRAF